MSNPTDTGQGAGPKTTPLVRPAGAAPVASTRPPAAGGTSRLGVTPTVRRTVETPGIVGGILVLCRWLQSLLLGMWLGGEMTLGMLVAVRAAGFFKTRVEAGAFLGPLFIRITQAGIVVGIVYLVLMLIHDGLWMRYHETTTGRVLTLLKTILSAGIVAGCFYLWMRAWPQMQQYQAVAVHHVVNGAFTGGAGRAFDAWHKIFEQVSSALVGAGAALSLLTQMSRRRR